MSTLTDSSALESATIEVGQNGVENLDDKISDDSTLFVGDLARSVDEEQLVALFSQLGNVIGVDVKRDKITNNNLGYGFIQFASREEATAALDSLDGYLLSNRKIRLGWASKNTNLYVFDIGKDMTDAELLQIFSAFGPLIHEQTKVHYGIYASVRFTNRRDAERAKNELEGKTLLSSSGELPCRITWGDSSIQFNCVHIQFKAPFAVPISEEQVIRHFERFGHIVKISLPRFFDGNFKGYGFIHFEDSEAGNESAAKAISSLHGSHLQKDLQITCNFGKKLVRSRKFSKRYSQMSLDPFYFHHPHMMLPAFQPGAHWPIPLSHYPSEIISSSVSHHQGRSLGNQVSQSQFFVQ